MIKKIGTLSFGLLVGAIISIACLPILTRLYGIDAYGIYGTLVAIVSVISVIANGRLDQAIIASPENRGHIIAASGLLVTVPVIFISGLFLSFFLEDYVVLSIILAVASNSLYQLNYSYNLRMGNLKFCSFMSVMRVSALCLSQIVFAVCFGSTSLLDGLLVHSILMLFFTLKLPLMNIGSIKKSVFLENIDFLKNNTSHALLNSLSHNLPYFLLSLFSTSTVVGYYAVVDRACKTPIVLISQSIRQLYIRKTAESGASKKEASDSLKASLLLLLVGSIFYFVVVSIPQEIYNSLLGNEWDDLKSYLSILGIGYVFVFSNPPVSGFLFALKRSGILFQYQVVEFFLKLVFFFSLINFFSGSELVLASFSLSLIIYNTLIIFNVNKFRLNSDFHGDKIN